MRETLLSIIVCYSTLDYCTLVCSVFFLFKSQALPYHVCLSQIGTCYLLVTALLDSYNVIFSRLLRLSRSEQHFATTDNQYITQGIGSTTPESYCNQSQLFQIQSMQNQNLPQHSTTPLTSSSQMYSPDILKTAVLTKNLLQASASNAHQIQGITVHGHKMATSAIKLLKSNFASATKKARKPRNKTPPKPRPKAGEIRLVTSMDSCTVLFGCPNCPKTFGGLFDFGLLVRLWPNGAIEFIRFDFFRVDNSWGTHIAASAKEVSFSLKYLPSAEHCLKFTTNLLEYSSIL